MTNNPSLDVLIVGAGPAGLAAALTLGRQQRRVVLADHGHPRNARVSEMHMYLSRDGEDPAELRRLARAEVARHPSVTLVDGEAGTITGSAGSFHAHIGDARFTARTVLLAHGVRDDLDGIPGLAGLWGRQASHCAYCHGYESREHSIAVIASNANDALLARYLLDRFSDRVRLFTTREAEEAVKAAAVGIDVDARHVIGMSPSGSTATLLLDDGTRVSADVVFHRPPYELSSPLAVHLGCELTGEGLITVAPTMATSVPGVYAAGDAAKPRDLPAPTQFVTSAAADGQRAAIWIEHELFRDSG